MRMHVPHAHARASSRHVHGACARRFVNALGPQEKNETTFACGPCTLKKGTYSIPVQWLNLVELTDEHAIFEVWPTEQDRIAATHVMDMPGLL